MIMGQVKCVIDVHGDVKSIWRSGLRQGCGGAWVCWAVRGKEVKVALDCAMKEGDDGKCRGGRGGGSWFYSGEK